MSASACLLLIYVLFFVSQPDRRRRLLNVLIALDSFIFVAITLGRGYPGETISSAAYRAEIYGLWFGKFRKPIDFLFSWLEVNHCHLAYEYAVSKRNLPGDMR